LSSVEITRPISPHLTSSQLDLISLASEHEAAANDAQEIWPPLIELPAAIFLLLLSV